jgi:photosystem II stability/assembly factor-like uncharacterized protein
MNVLAPPKRPEVELPEDLFKEAHQRRRRRRVLGASAIALVIVAVGLGLSAAGGAGGASGPTRMASGRDRPGTNGGSRGTAGSFKALETGILAERLDCVSETACFAVVAPQPGDSLHDRLTVRGLQFAKTPNGGATWMRVGSIPRQWSPHTVMSCPTVQMCALAVQRAAPHNNFLPAQAIAITQDGGSDWKINQLPLPADLSNTSVDNIVCTDELHCVAYVGHHASASQAGTFLSTSDGGATWTEASTVPAPASTEVIAALHCDLDGRCIALAESSQSWVTLTSTDFGAAWTEGPQASFPSSAVMNVSCGDALHCIYSTEGGGLAFTQNGGGSWGRSHVAVPDGQTITAVDCNSGTDCWAAASQWGRDTYANPVIYRSDDGGESWTTLNVQASASGWLISTVAPLSCPTSEGCIGIAQATPISPTRSPTKRIVISIR